MMYPATLEAYEVKQGSRSPAASRVKVIAEASVHRYTGDSAGVKSASERF